VRKVIAEQATKAAQGLEEPLFVFPEATTKDLNTLIPFKDGAFAPGVPVQPMLLKYQWTNCDPCWAVSGPRTLMLLARMLLRFHSRIELEFLPVVTPTEEEKQDPRLFAETVRTKMAKGLGAITSELGVEDTLLTIQAAKAHLMPEVGVVGYRDLRSRFPLSTKTVRELMKIFKKRCSDPYGCLVWEDYVKWVNDTFGKRDEAQCKILRASFEELADSYPDLDFRQFLRRVALVPQEGPVKGDTAVSAEALFAAFADGDALTSAACEAMWTAATKATDPESWWVRLHGDSPGRGPGGSAAAFQAMAGGKDAVSMESFVAHVGKDPGLLADLRRGFACRLVSS